MVGGSSFLTTKKEKEGKMVGGSSFQTTKKVPRLQIYGKSFGGRNAAAPTANPRRQE